MKRVRFKRLHLIFYYMLGCAIYRDFLEATYKHVITCDRSFHLCVTLFKLSCSHVCVCLCKSLFLTLQHRFCKRESHYSNVRDSFSHLQVKQHFVHDSSIYVYPASCFSKCVSGYVCVTCFVTLCCSDRSTSKYTSIQAVLKELNAGARRKLVTSL